MSSLGEALPQEIERVQEVIRIYESTPMGHIAAALMKHDVKEAHRSMISGDIVAMLRIHEKLKEWEL